jgi:hypothetical protein
MFVHAKRERHGFRAWWHFVDRKEIALEAYWWPPRFGVGVGCDDEGWHFHVFAVVVAVYLSIRGFSLKRPVKPSTWNGKTTWLVDEREFDFSVYDWTIRLTPWGRINDWHSVDPWWIRGVSFDIRRFVLGDRVYEIEAVETRVGCRIEMPEGVYFGTATISNVTRGFKRWFKRMHQEVWLEIPKGIPYAGKGENSWDCGDDGLFGIGGTSIDDAIQQARICALQRRLRYGHASADALRRALT